MHLGPQERMMVCRPATGVMRVDATGAVARLVIGHWLSGFTCIGHTTDHLHPQLSEAAHAGDGTCAAVRQQRHPTPAECNSLPEQASVSSLHAVTSSVDTRLQVRARHDMTPSSTCRSSGGGAGEERSSGGGAREEGAESCEQQPALFQMVCKGISTYRFVPTKRDRAAGDDGKRAPARTCRGR